MYFNQTIHTEVYAKYVAVGPVVHSIGSFG